MQANPHQSPSAEPRIPLLVPEMPTADDLLPWLRRIDATRWYSNFGPLCRELEGALGDMFARHNGERPHLTTVSNATLGLELALTALDLEPGARVLVPALTFAATATAVVRAGLVPVVTDIDPDSWLLTPAIARQACEALHVDAVLTVATFGCPHDVGPWDEFTAATGKPVIIDAAGAFGNQWQVGTTTLVFSMHATKSFAAGEGGMVVSRDAALVARVRQLSNFGINLDPRATTPIGQVDLPGTNAKLSEYHAAIGLANLARWPATAAARRTLFDRYRALLEAGVGGFAPVWQRTPAGITRTLLCFRVPVVGAREAIEVACQAANIETRRWYLPLIHQHDGFTELPVAGSLPVAGAVATDLLGLPFHTRLDEGTLARIVGAVARAAGPAA
ncbi:MAG: DegT/DnrJ/EryC1/StrS family aminotransferase [Burkholderiales bacterium]|nr:DegT/DnrJ/EryC1/StrS family aminotransferase [Burkholderiales bacterium]